MDRAALLAAFDEQVRRQVHALSPDEVVEQEPKVTRIISARGWGGVVWSDLDETSADAVIGAQVERFRRLARPWEWKHYSYDRPADLPQRLVAAGLVAEPAESLLVAELADLPLDLGPPQGVRLVPVVDQTGIDALVCVHNEVFGDGSSPLAMLAAALQARPDAVFAVVAMAGEMPIAAGRLELNAGTDFASLWGGGTVAAWRGRGVFRALVAYRARQAAAAGFRYLQVDASADSRPILKRLGFVELATTTPYMHSGAA